MIDVLVIIPTFNNEEFIEYCLESVKMAAHILIADCKSSDQTLNIAKQYNCHILSDLPHWSIKSEVESRNFITDYAFRNFKNLNHIWLDADEILTDNWVDYTCLKGDVNCISFPYWQLIGSSELSYINNPFETRKTVFKSSFPKWSKMYNDRNYHCWPNHDGEALIINEVERIHLGYTTKDLIERYLRNVGRLDLSKDEIENDRHRINIQLNPLTYLPDVGPTPTSLIKKSSVLENIIKKHQQDRKITLLNKRIKNIDYFSLPR